MSDWRHETPSFDDWEALKSELAYYEREPEPWVGPKGPDGKVLPQFRIAEGGFAPDGRAW